MTGPGSVVVLQTSVLRDRRLGDVDIPMTQSGFIITLTIEQNAQGTLNLTTTKAGAAVTANGFPSAAGEVEANTNVPGVITATQIPPLFL